MKNSGIEWIGEIPDSWSCLKAKYGIQSNDGGVWGNDLVGDENDKVVFRSTEQTIDGKWSIDNPAKRNFTFDISYYKILPGDLLITKSSGSLLHIGKTTLADSFFETNESYYSNFLQRIRLKAVFLPKYAWYLFNSILVREQFIYIQNSTSGLGNITASNIENIFVPLPLLKQQQQIVCFLDSRMEKIDALIEIQQAQIEKLKEYKQSVITEAVTKGIDPNVPMKDSGVEWIGQVPEQWKVKRAKYIATSIFKGNGITKEDIAFDGNTPCVRYGEIYTKYNISFKECKTRTNREKLSILQFFRYGDILFAGTGELVEEIGKNIVYLGEQECLAGGDIIVMRHKQDPAFLNYALYATCSQMQKSFGKAKLKVVHISASEIGNIFISLPTIKEQRKIADYLDDKCSKIDKLIEIKQSKIEKLQEYKKSLIYEYVTGKREVL